MLSPEETDKVCLEIASRFDRISEAEAAEEPPPSVLYHYTTTEGVFGIIKSGQLWATNVLFMNDASELSDASKLFHEEIRASPIVVGAATKLQLVDSVPGFAKSAPVDHFVASFSDGGDILGQWRAYASHGEGYAIGFRSSELLSSAGREENSLRGSCALRKVAYSDSKKKEMIGRRIAALREILEPLASELEPTDGQGYVPLSRIVFRIAGSLHSFLSLMKNEAFAGEQEWRLVRTMWKHPSWGGWPAISIAKLLPSLTEGVPIEVRSAGGRLVPYLPISWVHSRSASSGSVSEISIEEVVCGPSADPELKRIALRELLVWKCLEAKVSLSKVPLRV